MFTAFSTFIYVLLTMIATTTKKCQKKEALCPFRSHRIGETELLPPFGYHQMNYILDLTPHALIHLIYKLGYDTL